MATILARSRWTSTSARGSAITWSRVRGIVCHYPAMGASVGVLTMAQEAARLRGWRSYHVNSLGWQDIGYSYAIGQSGRIYSLRGDRVGGHTYGHNSTTLGVLFIAGDNEPLTAAAKASFRALRATLRKRGASSGVWGHREMSGNSTRCPGPYIMGSIRDGSLKAGSSGTTPSPSKPDTSRPWRTSPRVNGMSKAEVRRIQNVLLGFDISVGSYGADGSYGDDTGKAVKTLQTELNTTADGVYGPATERAVVTIREDIDYIKRVTVENQKRIDGTSAKVEAKELQRAIWGIGGGANAPMINRVFENGKEYPVTTLGSMTDRIVRQQIVPLRGEVAGLVKAVEQMSKGEGIDPEEIRKAVADGVDDALGSLEVTVSKGD